MELPTSLNPKMKIFIFSTIALVSCNVMLSALNYQQNQLIVKQQTNTDLLILESNPDYFGDAGFVRNNCNDRGE